ncbi:MAG: universal stress protein [Candidatus Neomarinimicrobiota bacterium]|jgi:hypothetical protein|nr:universal stress protein [Candidatus Neomarinimicrobiota bacterium]
MKLLLCINEKSEVTQNILMLTIKLVEAFKADLNIIVVGRKPSSYMDSEISITQQSLADWNLYHPGIDLLYWAFNKIIESGYISENPNVFQPDNFIEENNRIRIVLPHSSGSKVKLILRNGKLLNELRNENLEKNYELTIVEKPKTKRLIHNLIQFIDSSLLIVPNYDPNLNYSILLGINNAKYTKKAVIYSAFISKQFGNFVKSITVKKIKKSNNKKSKLIKWSKKYFTRLKVEYEYRLIIGQMVEKFTQEAKNNHIIVVGQANKNEIYKYLFSSKPIEIAKKAVCPILVVK